jgi:hypothetical protein
MLMVSFPVSADFVYSAPYPVLPILLNISLPACPKIMALENQFFSTLTEHFLKLETNNWLQISPAARFIHWPAILSYRLKIPPVRNATPAPSPSHTTPQPTAYTMRHRLTAYTYLL